MEKGTKHSKKTLKKISIAMKRHTPWNKGKIGVYSEETLRKMSKAKAGKKFSEEHCKALSDAHIGIPHYISEDARKRMIDGLKVAYRSGKIEPWNKNTIECFSKETITKMSKSHKRKWENLEYPKDLHIKNILKANMKRPTSLEQIVIELNRLLELNFKYVGNGTKIIRGRCPDFIDEENKIIVEVNGCYWHKCAVCGYGDVESETEKIDVYAKEGYSTIEIWEHELDDEFLISNRLMEAVYA